MAELDAELSRQFYRWEELGRGWKTFSAPVFPEPPFLPFAGYQLPKLSKADDGREHTLFSSVVSGVGRLFQGKPDVATPHKIDEAEPQAWYRGDLAEIQVILPPSAKMSVEAFAQWLATLSDLAEPITFEVFGTSERILVQFVVDSGHAGVMRRHLQGHFPGAVLLVKRNVLSSGWRSDYEAETAVVEFGLAREFMLPLAGDSGDLLVGITTALSELQPGEIGLFQVTFQPARFPWAECVLPSLTDRKDKLIFTNRPELVPASQRKLAQPFYAVVVRLASQSPELDRAWDIVREMALCLGALAHPGGNQLIPLRNDHYPAVDHVQDVVHRQCRRTGMLLNRGELLSLVHLPSAAVQTPKLVRDKGGSKAAPVQCEGILLGQNTHAGHTTDVRLSTEQRVRHVHVVGASGTGKSTLLFDLIRQDIENGEGLAILDPHGDLIEQILGIIPSRRIDDVVLLDPSDTEYAVGFNILSAHSELEKTLLASDLASVFKRLSSSWGDQMHSVLNNAILAFLESSEGGTLADLRRFLIDSTFREKVLRTVHDPEVVYYWRKSFPQLGGNRSLGPLMTRLETFLGPKPIRLMVSQRENRLDFGDIMDSSRIFLGKLSQGQIGKENSYLLGSLLMAKFQQQAMSRQAQGASERRPFWLYVDEFTNFISPSIAEILTGARKYNLGLILAHQELRQLQHDADVAGAVLANSGTRIVFRVGDADAKMLAEGFSSFDADCLRKLGTGEAICRIGRSDHDFNLSVPWPQAEDKSLPASVRALVIASSRAKHARPCSEIQTALMRKFEPLTEPEPTPVPKPTETSIVEALAPVPTIPVVESPSTPAEVPKSEPKIIPPPSELGRGGAQHQSIQQKLKSAAEDLGFRATIEKPILEGRGSVDLALEKDGLNIACEITITTTTDHEFGNVKKCIQAGFSLVAVISSKAERLNQIEAAVKAGLDSTESERIAYFLPDQFIAWLRELVPTIPASSPSPPAPSERTTRGYRVRRSTAKLSEEERKAKEDIALNAISESMKKPRKKK